MRSSRSISSITQPPILKYATIANGGWRRRPRPTIATVFEQRIGAESRTKNRSCQFKIVPSEEIPVSRPLTGASLIKADYQFWASIETAAKAPDDFKPFFEIARNAIGPYADAGKVVMLEDGDEVVPGISAILAPDHTVGHTMLRLSSRGSDLLVWGDIVHTAALQFPEPDRALSFDTDQAMAISSRRRVFDMVATDRVMIAGAHLSFPDLGHVAKASTDTYVPTPWNEDL
jgi:hypothetical protein